MNRIILMGFCGLFAAAPLYADSVHKSKPAIPQEDRESILRHKMRSQINAGLVGIVSEGTDYTVDLALSLTGEHQLRLVPIAGAGALQNAKDVMFARGVDLGILQTDVLGELKRNPPFLGVEKYLLYITELYDQELHILAGPDIQLIDDLAGRKVNFGLHDSGTYRTASAVFKAVGVQPDITSLSHPLALEKLRRGELSALAYLATKPAQLFQDIRPEENLHFLSIKGNLPQTYTSSVITSDDYRELVAKNAPVNTVAVGTVLVAYAWPTNSERYQRVNRFVRAFFAHLNEIKARRPKWRDFDVTASLSGWTRFPRAEQWLKKTELTPEPDRVTAQNRAPLDRKALEALFRYIAEHGKTQRVNSSGTITSPVDH